MSLYRTAHHQRGEVKLLIDYNNSLDNNVSLTRLNETFFDEKLSELEEIGPACRDLYWLTFARLNELTLYCTGNYADNFEFSAVGDMLVNPRLIVVHFRNRNYQVIKNRHMKLTKQFHDCAETEDGIVNWLKEETTLETKKKPLLPYFYENLEHSGLFTDDYLGSIDTRMKRVADSVGFFASSDFVDSHHFYLSLQNTDESEKALLHSKRCQFTTTLFDELGFDFYHQMRNGHYKSSFIR